MGGIILTGGGSNMPEIEKVFKTHTHIDKVRIAKFVTQTVNSKDPKITNHTGMMNTVLGLLAKGDMNCAGSEFNNDLFDNLDNRPTTGTGTETHKTSQPERDCRHRRGIDCSRKAEGRRRGSPQERTGRGRGKTPGRKGSRGRSKTQKREQPRSQVYERIQEICEGYHL